MQHRASTEHHPRVRQTCNGTPVCCLVCELLRRGRACQAGAIYMCGSNIHASARTFQPRLCAALFVQSTALSCAASRRRSARRPLTSIPSGGSWHLSGRRQCKPLATWRSAHAHGPEACRLSASPTVAKRMRAHARGYCAGLACRWRVVRGIAACHRLRHATARRKGCSDYHLWAGLVSLIMWGTQRGTQRSAGG